MRYRTKSAKRAAKTKAQAEWRHRKRRKVLLVPVPVSPTIRRLMIDLEWIQEGADRARVAQAIAERLEEMTRK